VNKSTPGPWVYVFEPDGYRHQILSDDSQVAQVMPSDSSAADGLLIAAAPDLLEALAVLVEFVEFQASDTNHTAIISARAAISKATGSEA